MAILEEALYGLAYKNWDLGLSKNFRTFEQQYLQFRADFFNVLNHANFGLPNSTINTPGAGQIVSAGPARRIQVAAYNF
jgi:hypothetical protein